MKTDCWLVTTSPANFDISRKTGFKICGLKERYKKTVQTFKAKDKIVYYINNLSKFGGTARVTSRYYRDTTRIWKGRRECWPLRVRIEPEIVLNKDEFLEAKKLNDRLSFINRYPKKYWSLAFQGSIHHISETDYEIIESEMEKIISRRRSQSMALEVEKERHLKSEDDYKKAIQRLSLQSKSLHNRLGEMLEGIGKWMDYNTARGQKITPEGAYELDVSWLKGKIPEVAIEIQISGSLDLAAKKLAEARDFNYRKVILITGQDQLKRLNKIMKFDPLRHWLDAWSIKSVFQLYTSGKNFFDLYRKLKEVDYKERKRIRLV